MEGNLTSKESIRIDGTVNGNIAIEGDVFIGSKAVINGNISAVNIFVEGTVNGNICAKELLKLLSSARLYGDIDVKTFVTDEGSFFEGKCSMKKIPDKKNINKLQKGKPEDI